MRLVNLSHLFVGTQVASRESQKANCSDSRVHAAPAVQAVYKVVSLLKFRFLGTIHNMLDKTLFELWERPVIYILKGVPSDSHTSKSSRIPVHAI